MRTIQKYVSSFICLVVFLIGLPTAAFNQDGMLVGLVDHNLVEIDPASGNLTLITPTNIPVDHNLLYLTYSISDCLFYSLLDPLGVPTLVSIDLEGNYTEIGALSIPGGTVYFCGGLSYNKTDGTLYAGASLNGDVDDQDFSAEAIIQIDPADASSSLVSTLGPGGTAQNDLDNVTFIDNELFIHDGVPGGAGQSFFYQLDFATLNATAIPVLNTTSPYYPIRDMGAIGTTVYFTTSDLELFAWDTPTGDLDFIGVTANTFNNQPVAGLEYVELSEPLSLNVMDTVLCQGESITLSTDQENAVVNWNTGVSDVSLTVSESGNYWAVLQVENCVLRTDTVAIGFQPCDNCDSILNTIQNELFIGLDTTICQGETLNLTLNLDPAFAISWNNGDQGPLTVVNASGAYAATVTIEDCSFTTNTLQLNATNCTICEYYIPNVFSPQGDGVNDTFRVFFDEENCEPLSFKLSIFDRWGGLLLETSENEWDGSFNDRPLAPGTYVYLVEITTEFEGEISTTTESGSVTLLR